MDKGLAVLLTAVAGGLIALQAPINAGLGRSTGSLPAALVSFASARSRWPRSSFSAARRAGSARPSTSAGTTCSAACSAPIYVTNALIAVSVIGAGGVAAATITGQLTASVAIDRLGLFGLDQVALTPERVAGVVLLLAGTVLIVR